MSLSEKSSTQTQTEEEPLISNQPEEIRLSSLLVTLAGSPGTFKASGAGGSMICRVLG